jgi:hypothetical protein
VSSRVGGFGASHSSRFGGVGSKIRLVRLDYACALLLIAASARCGHRALSHSTRGRRVESFELAFAPADRGA